MRDDRVKRQFTAQGLNQLWLTDITEHPTGEGKLYLCAIKDLYAGRIVGYSMAGRMQASLAVDALHQAVARRGSTSVVAGCVLHSDCGWQFRSNVFRDALTRHGLLGSMGQVGSAGGHGVLLRAPAEERARSTAMGHTGGVTHGDRDVDREDVSPAAPAGPAGSVDPGRVRDDPGPHDRTRVVRQTVTYPCTSPAPPHPTTPVHAIRVLRSRL